MSTARCGDQDGDTLTLGVPHLSIININPHLPPRQEGRCHSKPRHSAELLPPSVKSKQQWNLLGQASIASHAPLTSILMEARVNKEAGREGGFYYCSERYEDGNGSLCASTQSTPWIEYEIGRSFGRPNNEACSTSGLPQRISRFTVLQRT